MTDPIPTYYVHEETTAGPLYFYPLPAVRGDFDNYERHNVTWLGTNGEQAARRGGYVVTTMPAAVLTATWPKRPTVDHYELKVLDDMTPIGRQLAANPADYPGVLTREEWRDRCTCDHSDSCDWCIVREGMYRRVMTEPAMAHREYDVSGLTELDIYQADPAPELAWTLASPSLAAFYPMPAWHQFPGHLGGSELHAEVAVAAKAALGELGVPFNFYDYDTGALKLSAFADIPWDTPLPYEPIKPARTQKAREANYTRCVRSVQAMKWSSGDVRVPRRIAGATKAEALATRGRLLNELVAKLVPPHSVACSSCKGLGYIR
jgi:hypothetical protein